MFLISCLLVASPVRSEINSENVSIGGHFLGVGNSIWQADFDTLYNDRRQFDYGFNLDIEISFNNQINGFVQFQTSPGSGSFGFPGPSPDVTDLYLQFGLSEIKTKLTVGSFDTPFGINTNYLTNNADATQNAFFLNSLMYGVLGGPAGTLNAVGVMGAASWKDFELTSAIFNNLKETSENRDSYFGFTERGAIWLKHNLVVAGSYLKSNEDQFKNLAAWLAEILLEQKSGISGKVYYGELQFKDNLNFTEDGVKTWQAEIALLFPEWHSAIRISEWQPDDRNGDYSGASFSLPVAGLALTGFGFPSPPRDQEVCRYQAAIGKTISSELSLKVEFFRDDFKRLANGSSTDVDGLILLLQGSF